MVPNLLCYLSLGGLITLTLFHQTREYSPSPKIRSRGYYCPLVVVLNTILRPAPKEWNFHNWAHTMQLEKLKKKKKNPENYPHFRVSTFTWLYLPNFHFFSCFLIFITNLAILKSLKMFVHRTETSSPSIFNNKPSNLFFRQGKYIFLKNP